MATFRVAGASEYLAITGWGVDDVKFAKKAWVWLGQRCTTLDVAPASYEVVAQGVTSENFPVVVRAVYTVGPKIDDKKLNEEPLLLYAKLVAPPSRRRRRSKEEEEEGRSSRVQELVQGAFERHVSEFAGGMAPELISGKGVASRWFAKEVLERVQLDLGKFGIHVYSANVERLRVHVPASKYLSDVHKKSTQLGATTGFPVQMVVEGKVDAKKKLKKADEQLSKEASMANDTQLRHAHEGNAAWHAYRFYEQEWAKLMRAATQERDARKMPEIARAAIDNARKLAFALLVGGDAQGCGVQEQTGVAAPAESNAAAN